MPSATCKFAIEQFSWLKKIDKVQLFDFPEKHYILIPDFTIIDCLLQ